MRINGADGNNITRLYNHKQAQQVNKRVKKDTEGDSASISSKAREMQRLVKQTQEISDIREKKVQKIRENIKSGNYQVSVKDIADKLIEHMMKTR